MNNMSPRTLLFVLVAAVPLVVTVAVVVALLLMRAGFGVLIWAVLPFMASMLVIAALGAFLGRAASGRQRPQRGESSSEGPPRGRDGV